MSAPRSKRSSGRHEDERGKKRGRPSKQFLDSQIPHDAMSRIQAREMLRRHPALIHTDQSDLQFYEDLVSRFVPDQWDEDDEAEIDEEWDQSEVKENSKNLNTSQYASLFLLFKICLRLYRTTPIALISPVVGLRYQATSKNRLADEWIFTKSFCDKLAQLMVHPCMQQKTDMLALVLRWTATCRLDCRFKRVITFKTSCPALDSLFEELFELQGRHLVRSYHEMHKIARDRAIAAGHSPSFWSDLLYHIGEKVSQNTKGRPEVKPEFRSLWGLSVVPVTVWDLEIIIKVVKSIELKPEWNYSVEDALKAWKVEVPNQELPTQDKLSLIYKFAYKDVFRRLRFLQSPSSSVSGENEDEDGQDIRLPRVISFNDDFESEQASPSPSHSPSSVETRRIRSIGDEASDEASDEENESRSSHDEDSESESVINHQRQRRSVNEEDDMEDDMAGAFNGDDGMVIDEPAPARRLIAPVSRTFRRRNTLSAFRPRESPTSRIHSYREREQASIISKLKGENQGLRKVISDMENRLDTMKADIEKRFDKMDETIKSNFNTVNENLNRSLGIDPASRRVTSNQRFASIRRVQPESDQGSPIFPDNTAVDDLMGDRGSPDLGTD
ncbi:hypothetical protein IL306_000599 [Fusarium sp. DS 682]|nr:hypothetical protein IL306_000599 [Fusarium sp. DS 682]